MQTRGDQYRCNIQDCIRYYVTPWLALTPNTCMQVPLRGSEVLRGVREETGGGLYQFKTMHHVKYGTYLISQMKNQYRYNLAIPPNTSLCDSEVFGGLSFMHAPHLCQLALLRYSRTQTYVSLQWCIYITTICSNTPTAVRYYTTVLYKLICIVVTFYTK